MAILHVIFGVAGILLGVGMLSVQQSRIPDEKNKHMSVYTEDNVLHFGERFSLTFQRTLRIPDDGKEYPLPPGLGAFPLYKVEDFADRVPVEWRKSGGYFIPMYQREAMWIDFDGAGWKPNVVKIATGEVNVLDGEGWDLELKIDQQNYMVVPDQPWLDGIKAGEGYIRQFVAMPLGSGYTVEGQVTGKETRGGVQIAVFEPKPGRFPDSPPPVVAHRYEYLKVAPMSLDESSSMGLAAGGRMTQKVYPDTYGLDTWDSSNFGETVVYIVNSEMFEKITGLPAPSSPVTAKTYTSYGYPWFALYDEHKGDIEAGTTLGNVKGTGQLDTEKGKNGKDSTVDVPDDQIIVLPLKK